MESIKSKSVFPWNVLQEEIVISGIGGRYPESDSMDEFRDNLYNNVDMITLDDRRWPSNLFGLTHGMGKLKEIDKFDASFFGIVPKVADEVDPQGRIVLETSWEAIIDAGVNPQTLRGTNTGVYVGYTSVAMPDGVPQQVQDDLQSSKVESLLWFQGNSKAFYANRISFLFDLHGPSFSIDVACASSMICLETAVTDLRLGKCEQAIVAGVNINLQPFTNHIFMANNIASPEGQSKVWDQEADGYVRSETVCSMFLQRKSHAKRIYATILHTKTNIDGYKISGMFFPSTQSQYDLMVDTYTEAGIDPLDVNYFESHGTGTKVGDPQEARAILDAYCKNRKGNLPIGLLKSNIGHVESASGVAAITKVCIMFENKKIPANLNLNTIKSDIAIMVPPLDPVTENRDYEPGIVGINSFGIGGVNAHALLMPNQIELTKDSYQIVDAIPRLVNLNGRTEEAINYIFDFIETNSDRITQEFLTLLGETVNYEPSIYSAGFPFRGSMLIKQSDQKTYHYTRSVSKVDNVKRPTCYFFSGMGSQWSGMAKAMMDIGIFASSIKECATILKQVNVDLDFILLSEDSKALEDKIHHFVAITSVQIALVNVFKALGIEPDYLIGHSFGEITCAYVDGSLTLEQAILTSYWRGKVIKDSNIDHGMMAAVGLTWEDVIKKCPTGVYAACHNSVDSVTVSGAYDIVNDFILALTQEKVFAKEVQCANIPFHCPLLKPATERMTKILQNVIPEPKPRSAKWISTSIPEQEWSNEIAQTASAEYFVNNLINPVLFHDAVSKHLPKNAIIIEIASHTLFSTIFKRGTPNADYVGLMKRNNNVGNLDFYLSALGQLYRLGINMNIKSLYPKIQWPVPRNTQSISSLIRWDHHKSFLVRKYPDFHSPSTASDFIQKFSLANPDDQFLKDHAFNGRCILPAASYLLLAWRCLAASLGRSWFTFPVEFENVDFKRPVPLSEEETQLKVRLLYPTGEFIIINGNEISCSGKISSVEKIEFCYQHLIENSKKEICQKLRKNEFYTEMNVRGYDYGPKFKQIQQIEFVNFEKSLALIIWEDNFIPFFESLIQLYIWHTNKRLVYVTSHLSSIKCDPKFFYKSSMENFNVLADINLKFVATNGIEIKGLQFNEIPLKNLMKDLRMEKYQFVPFNESKAIENVDYQDLIRYIESCEFLTDFIRSIQTQSSLPLFDDDKLSTILEQQMSDNYVLLKILKELLKRMVDKNRNIIADGMIILPTIKKIITENEYDLQKDILNCSYMNNSRLMRSTLDVVNENGLRNIKIIEINYCGPVLIQNMVELMSGFFHYPLTMDYTLVTKNIKILPQNIKNSDCKLFEWNFDNSLPIFESPVDLFIYKDSIDLIEKLDLEVFTKEISTNVREGGFLCIVLRSKLYPSEKMIWNCLKITTEDLNKRINQHENYAQQNGFILISKKSDCLTSTCLLFRKQLGDIDPMNQIIVPVYLDRFEEWLEKLKITFSQYKNRPKNHNIWIVADDTSLNGILGMVNSIRQEPGGERFRCIYSLSKLPFPLDFNESPFKEILQKDLAINVFKENEWGTYRLLDLERNYNVIDTEDAFLDITKKGDMTTIQWINSPKFKTLNPIEVNVKICYSGLNHNDSLLCSGSLGVESIELSNLSLGSEFSGYRSDNGKLVMGIAYGRAIATSIDINPKLLLPVPNGWTLEDAAASINSLFLIWYSLVNQAHILPNETILIHPSTTAYGLTAIQIALQMNCRVIVTSNSKQQQKYLIDHFNIPTENLINIENPYFVDQILSLTDHSGVDLVFEAYSHRELITPLPFLKDFGRYIRLDQPKSNHPISRNATYFHISSLFCEESFKNIVPILFQKFQEWFTIYSKYFEPIPRIVFDTSRIDQAFATLNQEPIGKVLIRIHYDILIPNKIKSIWRTSFNSNKCYILVGGLGGLGLEVAYWMAIRGARKLVLVSRSGIKNEYQYVFIKRIENSIKNSKINIKIVQADASSMKDVENIVKESQELGPIGGIFHFATVLNDAFLEDQTVNTFKEVCAPKMNALICLDVVTRQLCPHLDYFVAFSSQTSSRGFIGQSNYGYANSVMEHICENRLRDRLPGQAIQYGPIGDVGLWAQNQHIDLTSIGMVIDTQRIPSCLEVLDRFLGLSYPVVASMIRLKDLQQNESNSKIKNHIWHGIGIDINSLPDDLSLGDVGMESILAIEMQQRIEREYEVNLNTDQIKQLTVKMIKEYQNGNKETIKESLIEFHNKS